jgi:hypothetical protein
MHQPLLKRLRPTSPQLITSAKKLFATCATPMSSVSRPDRVDIESLVQFHIYLKPNPDYSGLAQELKELHFSESEIFNVLHKVREGYY